MYLKHITLKNFRAYYGEHTLEFSPTLGHSISIVAGNNGHGKTSLLTALLWCLYGRQIEQVEESYKNDIKAKKNYENYIRDLVNRKALEDEIPMAPRSYQVRSLAKPNSIDYKNNHMYVELVVGDFTLPFLTSEENQSMQLTLTIRRSVRIVSGVPFDSLSVIGSGTESFAFEDDSTRQTFILNYVLPVEMAKFYLFDAERVVQIAQNFDSRDMQKQLAQNFEEIFGIKKYVEVKAKLQASYERQKKEAAPLGKQMKLNDLERRILGAEREYEDVKNQIDRLESQRSELDDERTELYTQVTDSRTVSRQDYEDARRQYEIKHSEEAHYKELLGKELANAPLLLLARRLEEFNSCLEIELKHEEQVRQLNAQRREAHKISGTIRRELESLNEKWIQSSEYGEYISQPIMNEISTKINEVLESTLAPADTIKTKPPTNFRKDFSENELAHFTRSLDQVMKGGGGK